MKGFLPLFLVFTKVFLSLYRFIFTIFMFKIYRCLLDIEMYGNWLFFPFSSLRKGEKKKRRIRSKTGFNQFFFGIQTIITNLQQYLKESLGIIYSVLMVQSGCGINFECKVLVCNLHGNVVQYMPQIEGWHTNDLYHQICPK